MLIARSSCDPGVTRPRARARPNARVRGSRLRISALDTILWGFPREPIVHQTSVDVVLVREAQAVDDALELVERERDAATGQEVLLVVEVEVPDVDPVSALPLDRDDAQLSPEPTPVIDVDRRVDLLLLWGRQSSSPRSDVTRRQSSHRPSYQ
jgi:hypothetical protein